MTRRELQQSLKTFREQGLTTIKLTAKTEELQAEFDRMASCTIFPELKVTETSDTEVAETNEHLKETPINLKEANNKARMQGVFDESTFWVDVKTWQIIHKHKEFKPIFNRRALEKSEYARTNGHGMYLPPQAIEHKYFTNMNTQSLNELEAIEQRLNEIIAEAKDIDIKCRLNNALVEISTTLDEAFKDA